jgi:hypothetical protein
MANSALSKNGAVFFKPLRLFKVPTKRFEVREFLSFYEVYDNKLKRTVITYSDKEMAERLVDKRNKE